VLSDSVGNNNDVDRLVMGLRRRRISAEEVQLRGRAVDSGHADRTHDGGSPAPVAHPVDRKLHPGLGTFAPSALLRRRLRITHV